MPSAPSKKATRTEFFVFPEVALLLILGLWSLQAEAFKAPRVEMLYIDANVGSASGGHVALRLDDEVYHFQNEQGTTRLTRDDWSRFRWVYNDIENRNIEAAQLQVSPLDAEQPGREGKHAQEEQVALDGGLGHAFRVDLAGPLEGQLQQDGDLLVEDQGDGHADGEDAEDAHQGSTQVLDVLEEGHLAAGAVAANEVGEHGVSPCGGGP